MDLQGVFHILQMKKFPLGMTRNRLTTVFKRIAWRANKSIVLRTIVRKNFILSSTSVTSNRLVGNITGPDSLYSLFLCACWVFGDALLATHGQGTSRGFCCNVPSRTLTLRNPLGGERGWAICFSTQFYPTPTPEAQVNRPWSVSRSQL